MTSTLDSSTEKISLSAQVTCMMNTESSFSYRIHMYLYLDTHTHSPTHSLTRSLTQTLTHTLSHSRMHARTHARTHTRTHVQQFEASSFFQNSAIFNYLTSLYIEVTITWSCYVSLNYSSCFQNGTPTKWGVWTLFHIFCSQSNPKHFQNKHTRQSFQSDNCMRGNVSSRRCHETFLAIIGKECLRSHA